MARLPGAAPRHVPRRTARSRPAGPINALPWRAAVQQRLRSTPLHRPEIASGDDRQSRRFVGNPVVPGGGRRWRSRRARRRSARATRCAAGRPASWAPGSAAGRFSRLRLEWSTRSGRRSGPGLERDGQPLLDQAEGHGFVEAGAGQELADGRLDPLVLAARRARQRDRPVFGNVFVAVNPRDLLDQVDLALQVAPPAKADGQLSDRSSCRGTRAPGLSRSAPTSARSMSIPRIRSIWPSRS